MQSVTWIESDGLIIIVVVTIIVIFIVIVTIIFMAMFRVTIEVRCEA